MERAVKGPQMYVCMTWSRACPPVEWGSAKAENMYTKRVAERDGYVYNLMPLQVCAASPARGWLCLGRQPRLTAIGLVVLALQDVPKSMSGRVGQVFTVE